LCYWAIESLKKELDKDKDVYAFWLEGADSLGAVAQQKIAFHIIVCH